MKTPSISKLSLLVVLAGLTSAPAFRSDAAQQNGVDGTAVTAATGSIAGRVVDYASGRPLRKVPITLTRNSPVIGTQPDLPAPEPPAVPDTPDSANNGNFPFGAPRGGPPPGFFAALEARNGRSGEPVEVRTETAMDGTFAFTELPTGSYVLWAYPNHYHPQSYGQRLSGTNRGRLIAVHPGEQVESIDFHVTKKSSITGTIFDQNGAPRANAEVQALSRPLDSAADFLWPAGNLAITDDRGRYRLDDLDPDDYMVMARPATVFSGITGGVMIMRPNSEGNGLPADGGTVIRKPREVYVAGLYPSGGNDLAQAGVIHVPIASDIQGIDMVLRPTLSSVISGTVLPAPEDPGNRAAGAPRPNQEPTPPFRAQVSLLPIGWESRLANINDERSEPRELIAGSDGRFQFDNLVPGRYRLSAYTGFRESSVAAVQDVDVRPGITETLTLPLRNGIEVSGRIYFDDPFPRGFDSKRVTALFDLEDPHGAFSFIDGKINPDGTFVVKGVFPDLHYRVGFANIDQRDNDADESRPAGYVVSARAGDLDLLSGPVLVSNGGLNGSPIEAHIGFAAGRVEIRPTDQGRPQQGIQTILVPQGPKNRSTEIRISDARGIASFGNVVPGDYKVFAWDEVREGAWLKNGFFNAIEDRGRSIHVDNRGTTMETVPIIKIEAGDLH